jgi:ADP-ribosylglycohydrolase
MSVTTSAGFHGLVRCLPVGLLGSDPPSTWRLAADFAALTHGAPEGVLAAADGALFVAAHIAADDVMTALEKGVQWIADGDSPLLERYRTAIADAQQSPGVPALLARHSSDRTAAAALCGALYAAASFPGQEEVLDALSFAAAVPGAGVAATTGALLGALHGVDALPPRELSRLELVWVADILARDLVSELTGSPGGHETMVESEPRVLTMSWQEGTDPSWWHRYPGW